MAKRQYSLNPLVDGVHNDALFQPQLTNHFEVYIMLNQILGVDSSVASSETQSKYLNLATTDFNLPNIATTPIDIPYGNTTIHIAGKTEFGGADTLSCVDYIGADIERIIYNWQMLVTNPETGQQGWAYNYKCDARVIEYAPDGSCLSTWILKGVWPSAVNYGSMSKSSADVKKVEVTLSYDLAYKAYDEASGRGNMMNLNDNSTLKKNVKNAKSNMTWQSQSKYAQSNNGGALGWNGVELDPTNTSAADDKTTE